MNIIQFIKYKKQFVYIKFFKYTYLSIYPEIKYKNLINYFKKIRYFVLFLYSNKKFRNSIRSLKTSKTHKFINKGKKMSNNDKT